MQRADPKAVLARATSPTSSGDQRAELDNRRKIDALFALLKVQYPMFLNHLGSQEIADTKRVWLAHLDKIPAERIEAAARQAPNFCPRFPPTIGEFLQILADIRPRPEHQDVPRLANQAQSTPGVARRNIDEMLKTLRGNPA